MTTNNGCSGKNSANSSENKTSNGNKIALLVENLRETYRWHGYLLEELSKEVKASRTTIK